MKDPGAATHPMTSILEVMLVDDHEKTRAEICSLLETEPDITVVAQSTNAEDGIEKARKLKPTVVVMDLALPGMNGLAATQHLQRDAPACQVLVLSNHVGKDLVKASLTAGAKGYLRKDRAYEELVEAVRAVACGRQFLGEGLVE